MSSNEDYFHRTSPKEWKLLYAIEKYYSSKSLAAACGCIEQDLKNLETSRKGYSKYVESILDELRVI